MMNDDKENVDVMKGYALGRTEQTAINNVIRNLCGLVNEHTLILMALMKKFGTNPEALLKLLDECDFLNDADTPKQEETN